MPADFQRRGAATQKERSPAVESHDLRMTSLLNEAEPWLNERSRVLQAAVYWVGWIGSYPASSCNGYDVT